MVDPDCGAHIWMANRGRGGEPRFHHGRMVVGCLNCPTFRHVTEKEWFAMPAALDSESSSVVPSQEPK